MEIAVKSGYLLIFFGSLLSSCQPKPSPEEKHIADSLAIRAKYAESPVLSAEKSMKKMRVEKGFKVELVAEEPLLRTPVAMTFDEKGRIWVVEMNGYMPDTVGTGEERPSGTIAILEDRNGDGKMDLRKVFMDSLVLPRAICLIDSGLLVAEPPNLWYVEKNGDVAGKKILVDPKYAIGGNVEHQPNGLFRALDNWIYNAKSDRRYRKKGDKWLIERTVFRGQWGISQDDQGRLYYNHNSANLLGDYFPPRFGTANPSQENIAGYSEAIVRDNRVYPLRPNTGINRGYLDHMLNDSLRLVNFTAASGPVIYRGALLGPAYRGNAFVPEPSANLVKRDIIEYGVNRVIGEQAYKHKEFLASTDERFRPVSAYNGPDGALYLVDMYRGIIQHVTYLTDYLKKEIRSRDLSMPLNMGRIYKVIPRNSDPSPVSFPSDPEKLIALLDHENGWVRDKAQQLLVDRALPESIPLLKKKLAAGGHVTGLIHALWTLEGLYALEWDDVAPFLSSGSEQLVAQGLTALPSVVDAQNQAAVLEAIRPLSERIRLAPYIAYVLPYIAPFAAQDTRQLLNDLAHRYPNEPRVADAIISNLDGREAEFLQELNQWNPDTALLIKKHLKGVLKAIREREQARLKEKRLSQLARGQELYKHTCATCHGADGKGIRSLAPPLNRSEWVTGPKERLISIVLYGLTGPVEVNGHLYDKEEIGGEMPGIGNNDALSDDDIAQIISFIRNAWNNDAGLVNEEEVSGVREVLKDRKGGAFTVAELEALSFDD